VYNLPHLPRVSDRLRFPLDLHLDVISPRFSCPILSLLTLTGGVSENEDLITGNVRYYKSSG
jgi:hypothetical protein